jgi:hypothetical protein
MQIEFIKPRGVRHASAIITVAAAATPEVLYQQTQSGNVNKTLIVKKIWIYSNVGACVVQIGTGLAAAFAQLIPPMLAVNGVESLWQEEEIPCQEANADLTVQSSVLGCLVQVEVEEIG